MKIHWYDKCAKLILEYKKEKKASEMDAYEVLNSICKILEHHGFIDADWWAENEKLR